MQDVYVRRQVEAKYLRDSSNQHYERKKRKYEDPQRAKRIRRLARVREERNRERPNLLNLHSKLDDLEQDFNHLRLHRFGYRYGPHVLPLRELGIRPQDLETNDKIVENTRKYVMLVTGTEGFYVGEWKDSDMLPIYAGAIPWVIHDEHAISAAEYAVSFLNDENYPCVPVHPIIRDCELRCGGDSSSRLNDHPIIETEPLCGGDSSSRLNDHSITETESFCDGDSSSKLKNHSIAAAEDDQKEGITLKQLIRVNVQYLSDFIFLLTIEASDNKFYEAMVFARMFEGKQHLEYIRPAKYYPEIPANLHNLVGPNLDEQVTQFDNNPHIPAHLHHLIVLNPDEQVTQ